MIYNRIPRDKKAATASWSANNTTLSAFDSYLKAYFPLSGLSANKGGFSFTNNGSVSFENDGIYGKCATFSGSNTLSASYSADLQLDSGNWLLSLWLKPASTADYNSFFCSANTYGYGAIFTLGNTLILSKIGNGSGGYDVSDNAGGVTQNVWNHFMIYYTGGVAYAVVNGTQRFSRTATIAPDTDSPLVLGYDFWYEGHYTGQLAGLAIWKGTALSADARTALYNSGNGSFYKG